MASLLDISGRFSAKLENTRNKYFPVKSGHLGENMAEIDWHSIDQIPLTTALMLQCGYY